MTTKVRKKLTEKKVKRSLSRVEPNEAKEILSEIAEATDQKVEKISRGRIPGEVIHGTKTAFTLADFEKVYGIEEFTPDETIKFTIQGVERQFIEGVSGLYPSNFVLAYHARKRQMRQKPTLPESGFINMIGLGAGGLEPE